MMKRVGMSYSQWIKSEEKKIWDAAHPDQSSSADDAVQTPSSPLTPDDTPSSPPTPVQSSAEAVQSSAEADQSSGDEDEAVATDYDDESDDADETDDESDEDEDDEEDETPVPEWVPDGSIIQTFTFKRNVEKKGKVRVKETKFHLLNTHSEVQTKTHEKMGMLLGPFKGSLGGDMCDIPECIATDATISSGVRKPATKSKGSQINMKNKAYLTLNDAVEQIVRFAEHSRPRTSGLPHDDTDKRGCGVPVGIIWTSKGSQSGGSYRIKWGHAISADEYIRSKKCCYAKHPGVAFITGRAPQMLYQPNFHGGEQQIPKGKRKVKQTTLAWIWSGAISSQQEYAPDGFDNKAKWDGFCVQDQSIWTYESFIDGHTDGQKTRIYYPTGADGGADNTGRLCFNRLAAKKAKKGRKKSPKYTDAELADMEQTKKDEAAAMEQMLKDLEADSDDDSDW